MYPTNTSTHVVLCFAATALAGTLLGYFYLDARLWQQQNGIGFLIQSRSTKKDLRPGNNNTAFDINTDVLPETFEAQNVTAPNKPFFISAGLGTTGTRTLFRAMCKLGIPGVHWKNSCVNSGKGPVNEDVDASLMDGLQVHRRIFKWFYDLKECAVNSRIQNKTFCPDLDFEELNLQLLDELTALVKSDLMFVSDTPYPYLFPQLLQVAKQEGRNVVVILTERDPTQWARSRIDHHAQGSDVMCDKVEHAFDLRACMQKEQDITKLLFKHTEIGRRKNIVGHKVYENEIEYMDFLASALKIFHRTIKNQDRTININFWNEALREMEDVRPALLTRMAHWLPPSAVAPYANATALTIRGLQKAGKRTGTKAQRPLS